MRLLRTKAELRAWRASQDPKLSVGFVPTMGALHAGHLSLVQASRAACDRTVASIFVNPLQFGPKEDLARYPRPFDRDRELLEAAGCDALFAPDAAELYPADLSTYVVEETVSASLCGALRPGHFQGVTTVVLKLLNLVQPHRAYFGQKDAQQCAVLERMVRDLDVPVELIREPTLREPDGLAMSSRNTYLSESERQIAVQLSRGLFAAQSLAEAGETRAERLRARTLEVLSQAPELSVQYCELRHPHSLAELEQLPPEGAVLAVAALLGKTRLIDNLWLRPLRK
jgi:pantoate--beta-alanine ligase